MGFGGQDGRLSVGIGTWQIDRDSAETDDRRLCHAIEDDSHIRLVSHFVFLTTLTPSRCALIRMKQGADCNPSGAGLFTACDEAAERLMRPAIYRPIGAESHRNSSDYPSFGHKDRTGAPSCDGAVRQPFLPVRSVRSQFAPFRRGSFLIHSAQGARTVRDAAGFGDDATRRFCASRSRCTVPVQPRLVITFLQKNYNEGKDGLSVAAVEPCPSRKCAVLGCRHG